MFFSNVYRFLKDFHHQVHEIPYVQLRYRNNKFNLLATFAISTSYHT